MNMTQQCQCESKIQYQQRQQCHRRRRRRIIRINPSFCIFAACGFAFTSIDLANSGSITSTPLNIEKAPLEDTHTIAHPPHTGKRPKPPTVTTKEQQQNQQNENTEKQPQQTSSNLPPMTPRIIGGSIAPQNRYPYLVSLIDPTRSSPHICGGTLLSPDIVLTAAHCFNSFTAVELHRYDISDTTEIYETFIVRNHVRHPMYRDKVGEFNYDFMILQLYGKSSIDAFVTINSDPDIPSTVGTSLTVLGWGDVDPSNNQELADELRYAEVNYVSNDKCEESEGEIKGFYASLQGLITNVMMCASDVNEDACQGDSGGPLILPKKKSSNSGVVSLPLQESYETDVQVGVVSWGLGCAHPEFPGVYARISTEYDWIRRVVCDLSYHPPQYFNCDEFYDFEDETKSSSSEDAAASSLGIHNGEGGDSTDEQEDNDTPEEEPLHSLIEVIIDITLDRDSQETGWLLEEIPSSDDSSPNKKPHVHAFMPIGSYENVPDQTVRTTLELKSNAQYRFIMLDRHGDGMCCTRGNGSYCIYSLQNVGVAGSDTAAGTERMQSTSMFDDENRDDSSADSGGFTILLEGSGVFENAVENTFYLGVPPTQAPTISPAPHALSTTSPPSPSPALSEDWKDGDYIGKHFITIAIQFDLWPEDTGWILERTMNDDDNDNGEPSTATDGDQQDENAAVVPGEILSIRRYGSYTEDFANALVMERVPLISGPHDIPSTNEKRNYLFTIGDDEYDGLCCEYGSGFYAAYLGTVEDGTFLFEGSQFGGGEAWTFSVSFEDDEEDNGDGDSDDSEEDEVGNFDLGGPPIPPSSQGSSSSDEAAYEQEMANETNIPSYTEYAGGTNTGLRPPTILDPVNSATRCGLTVSAVLLLVALIPFA